MHARDIRLPLAPLLVAARGATISGLAREVGVARRTVHRWQHAGLRISTADRAAVMLGLHPADVWPLEWAAAEQVMDDRAARKLAYNREWRRQWYQRKRTA